MVLTFQIIGGGRENQQYTNSKGIWSRAERDKDVSRNKSIDFPGSETHSNTKLIFKVTVYLQSTFRGVSHPNDIVRWVSTVDT